MILTLAKILVPFLVIFNIIPVLIWLERKGAAYIQDRRGPNRASLFGMIRLGGMIHSLADVVKLFSKEDIIPARVNRFFYILAPFTAMTVACVTYAVIPFADSIQWNGQIIAMQAANLNAGILYILAISSLGVFGVMLAGWSSNNKYSLLGGLRSSAQMISYEVVLSLAVVSVLMMSGSLELSDIIGAQGTEIWKWNFVRQPVACILFIIAMFAETNRLPFDLPEGESEIVAGYHVEYSSMKFALFFMAEYANMIIASAVLVVFFFAGWQVPFLTTEILRTHSSDAVRIVLIGLLAAHLGGALFLLRRGFDNVRMKKWGDRRDYEPIVLGVGALGATLALAAVLYFLWNYSFSSNQSALIAAILQFGIFIGKILFFCWVFIWVRWTFPRFRYDQLMRLGWKYLLPIGLLNIFATGVAILLL